MPGFDRTGPRGQGPRTGGGFGYCGSGARAGAPVQDPVNNGPAGAGWGYGATGGGWGRGGGRGRFCRRRTATMGPGGGYGPGGGWRGRGGW